MPEHARDAAYSAPRPPQNAAHLQIAKRYAPAEPRGRFQYSHFATCRFERADLARSARRRSLFMDRGVTRSPPGARASRETAGKRSTVGAGWTRGKEAVKPDQDRGGFAACDAQGRRTPRSSSRHMRIFRGTEVALLTRGTALAVPRFGNRTAAMGHRVAHIVQRMAPGGLEVLVLELARQLPGEHVIVSLEGEADALAAAWPRLARERAAAHRHGEAAGPRPRSRSSPARAASRAGDRLCVHPSCGTAALRRSGRATRRRRSPHSCRARRLAVRRPEAAFVSCGSPPRSPARTSSASRRECAGRCHRVYPGRSVEIIANGVALDRYRADRAEARAGPRRRADDAQSSGRSDGSSGSRATIS